MQTNFLNDTRNTTVAWHDLYRAALFETDRSKVPQRITAAEQAILVRIKDLFGVDTDHIEEDQVLDDALYALRALRNCVVHDESGMNEASAA